MFPQSLRFLSSFDFKTRALLFALLTIASSVAQAQNAQTPQTLAPEQTVERQLAGGQMHAYQVALGAGQYLEVTVAQRGIDALRVPAAGGA